MPGIGLGRPPLRCVNSKSCASVASGKTLFQLYLARTMLCPSRKAATENSIGIVGMLVGAALTSNTFRLWVNTSVTTAGVQILGR